VQTAAVRYLHTAIESMIDIANHVVARRGLMVAFRNRAVHLYDEIDADEVYEILTERLGDFDDFVSAIATRFFTSPPG